MSAFTALRRLLLNDTDLANAVRTSGEVYRIWPMKLRSNPTLPAIVYSSVSTPREHTHGSVGGDAVNGTFQLDCWATDFDAARALFALVRKAVNGKKITLGDTRIDAITVAADRTIEDEDTQFWRVVVDLNIMYVEVYDG